MAENIIVPRHLFVLVEAWKALAARLQRDIAPALPLLTEQLEHADLACFKHLARQETDALLAWIERLVAWCNGPLAVALANPAIPDRDMRRVAERLSHFADELIERRQGLRALANTPAMRAAAPRLDVIHASLLEQIGDFVSGVVRSMDPAAPHDPHGKVQGNTLELSFTFSPDVERPFADYHAWLDQVRADFDAAENAAMIVHATVQPVEAAAYPPASALWIIGTLVIILVALVAWAIFEFGIIGTLLLILLIALVIFAIRHPWLTLIALWPGWN